ncbi:peptide/nickel transport system ATP-binding protein [Aureimonas altamirensis DSM 21988]|uniref:Peptide/nickel transport system ATP-binding protein n=1 Tax=Aureimonas altamirensis DSM 21988 TaxID=1121026 RepID=A0ABY1ICS5_9HYPH|nr:ABC transporter ATP-binding protein [Aureimonas altamirensis]SHI98259.1 peptide/nickel transport system ATP-binding protein [Aureimonas altamirensis DSM 21988]
MNARLDVDHVSKLFTRKPGMIERAAEAMHVKKPSPVVHALDDVSLSVPEGSVLGIVGESGCGKSTLGRVMAGLLDPSMGTVRLRGKPVDALSTAERARERLRVQMIFQDPSSSLNPRQRLADIIGAAPLHHGMTDRRRLADYVTEQMTRAGLDPAMRDRFPHQLSGGQRQRVGIARALAVQPEVLICDESVAALDVSIQAQIINLFLGLRESLDLTYVFISHDLSVVEHISDRVAVMYLGRVVEEASVEDLFANAAHPYTQALLAERPSIAPGRRSYHTIKGEIPSPVAPPPGCHFHPRCPVAFDRCQVERPVLRSIGASHTSACHLNG